MIDLRWIYGWDMVDLRLDMRSHIGIQRGLQERNAYRSFLNEFYLIVAGQAWLKTSRMMMNSKILFGIKASQ